MLILRVAQRPSTGGTRWVDLTVDGDGAPQAVTARFAFTVAAQDAEAVRWYLEDYLEYPMDETGANRGEVDRPGR